MQSEMQHLRVFTQTNYGLTDEEWAIFSAQWFLINAKKKQILTRPSEKASHLYFVCEGLQRLYYFDADGREATLVFTYPYSFGGVIDSILLDTSSKFYYESLTASVLLALPSTEFLRLTREHDFMKRLVIHGLAGVLSGVLERLAEIQCCTSKEKYQRLLKRSPHILHLIPHRYLANYLGIDATNFSKLINSERI